MNGSPTHLYLLKSYMSSESWLKGHLLQGAFPSEYESLLPLGCAPQLRHFLEFIFMCVFLPPALGRLLLKGWNPLSHGAGPINVGGIELNVLAIAAS